MDFTFLLLAQKKSNQRKGSTNTAPFPAAGRLASALASSEPRYSCTSTRDNSLLIFLGLYQLDVTKIKTLST
jgi:hypothetical protein